MEQADDLRIQHASGDGGGYIQNYTGDLQIQNRAADKDILFRADDGSGVVTSYLVLDGSTTHAYFSNPGNVGIGTTSPTQKLHVAGNARVTGAIYDSNNSPGTANQVLISTVTGTDWVDGSGSSIIGGPYLPLSAGSSYPLTGVLYLGNVASDQKIQFQRTGGNVYSIEHDSNKLYFYNRTTTESPLIIQNDGDVLMNAGNVGIGTTSPSYKLTSYSSGDEFAIVAGAGNAVGEFTGIGLSGYIATNAAVKAGLVFERETSWGIGKMHFLNNNTLGDSDATLSDSKMTIDSSGNVGIGTTSPTAKLHVVAPNGTNVGSGNFNFILDAQDVNSVDSNGLLVKGGADNSAGTTFAIQDYSGNTDFMVNGAGNVGIGTD